jgi:hypothetical protein
MTVFMLFVLGALAGVAGDQLADSLGQLWRVGGYVVSVQKRCVFRTDLAPDATNSDSARTCRCHTSAIVQVHAGNSPLPNFRG